MVIIEALGGPGAMRLVDRPVGEPGPGEIRIRQHACGLNFIDVWRRTGTCPPPLPAALGMEASGVVEAVGAGVSHLRPGGCSICSGAPPGSRPATPCCFTPTPAAAG